MSRVADGVHIRHSTARSRLVLIPLMHKPLLLDSVRKCNGCNIVHPVKIIHLWVDDTGGAIVSTGVLTDLKRAGMPDLQVVGTLKKPPTLNLGRGVSRPQVDQANRKQTLWQAIRRTVAA